MKAKDPAKNTSRVISLAEEDEVKEVLLSTAHNLGKVAIVISIWIGVEEDVKAGKWIERDVGR